MSRRRRKPPPPPEAQPGFADPLLDERPVAELDLHGVPAADAERRVMDFVQTMARLHAGRVVRIITGKGLHSPAGPVLLGVVEGVLKGPGSLVVGAFRRDPFGGGIRVRVL